MHRIMVANPKGGCGKSTLAIHLASWFAQRDERVCLVDLDRQQSSRYWLERRPASLPPICSGQIDDESVLHAPADCTVAIIDTPAGLHGKALKRLLGEVNRVVVPVSPSRFDMQASLDFFEELAATKALRKERVSVAIVGMRVEPRTLASQELMRFLAQFELPLVTCLRSSQRYVQAVESGVSVLDGRDAAGVADRAQWQPLLDWLVRSQRTQQR